VNAEHNRQRCDRKGQDAEHVLEHLKPVANLTDVVAEARHRRARGFIDQARPWSRQHPIHQVLAQQRLQGEPEIDKDPKAIRETQVASDLTARIEGDHGPQVVPHRYGAGQRIQDGADGQATHHGQRVKARPQENVECQHARTIPGQCQRVLLQFVHAMASSRPVLSSPEKCEPGSCTRSERTPNSTTRPSSTIMMSSTRCTVARR